MPISLVDPLDGAELKQIILDRISAALDRDCTLANDIAYAGFALFFDIKISYKRAETKGTLVWGNTSEGEIPDSAILITHDEYETDSPNTARLEHDLGIPVMVATPNGMERRKVRGRPPKSSVAGSAE